MLAIITCIRHPETAKNFSVINQLLQGTLNSINNQTSDNYKFFVVCNRGSEIDLKAELIDVDLIFVDFLPPKQIKVVDEYTQELQWQSVRKDKGLKYYVGLLEASKSGCDFAMFIDADDFLHKNVVSYIEEKKFFYDGFIVGDGYCYPAGSAILGRMTSFNRVCGTSNCFKMTLLSRYLNFSIDISEDTILGSVDKDFIYNVLGSHLNAISFIEANGGKYKYFPFPAAIYLIDNGENDSGVNRLLGVPMRLTREIREDFAIDYNEISTIKSIGSFFMAKIYFELNKYKSLMKLIVWLKKKLI